MQSQDSFDQFIERNSKKGGPHQAVVPEPEYYGIIFAFLILIFYVSKRKRR